MMKLNPYLNFNGQCKEAFEFYERSLGGKIVAMFPFAGSPAEQHVPAEWRDRVMHATLQVGDEVLMGSDAPPGLFQPTQGMSVSINIKDAVEAERIFKALSEKGKITMPMEKTFWAERFGMCVDRFGTPWMVNCEAAA